MKLCSWNVNGIRAVLKKDVLLPFLAEANPDVMCIQETKAQQSDVKLDLPGYEQYWYSAEKKGYSGTALFARKSPLDVRNGFGTDIIEKYKIEDDGYGNPANEGRVITAEFDQVFVVTVYTPNAKDDLTRVALRHEKWDPAFLEHCKQLEAKKPVVFCGDLNVAHKPEDLANPGPNRGKKGFTDEERAGFQAFVDDGFVDSFRLFTSGNGHYTWWSMMSGARARNAGWRIDYVLVSEVLKSSVKAANIHPDVMGSDHCPVSIELDFSL
jgi:exodeoxyribonuclease III